MWHCDLVRPFVVSPNGGRGREERVNPVLLDLPFVTLIQHEGEDIITCWSLAGPCLLILPH